MLLIYLKYYHLGRDRLVEHESDGIYVLRARRSVKVNYTASFNDEEISEETSTPEIINTTSRPTTGIYIQAYNKNTNMGRVQTTTQQKIFSYSLQNFFSKRGFSSWKNGTKFFFQKNFLRKISYYETFLTMLPWRTFFLENKWKLLMDDRLSINYITKTGLKN